MKKFTSFLQKSFFAFVSLSLFMTIAGSLFYLYLDSQLPVVHSLNDIKLQVPLRIYTEDGKLIQEYGEKKRIPVAYNNIPKPLVQAILATEDQRYFDHSGVDVLGLGRAALRMIQTGTKSQGGSTITMQVARNFFLSRKKTFLRKFKEILLAIKIDRELSKEKILELYLNKIYLGNRAYGVGAAAQVYFGKSLSELTLAEMAMIAGLPQSPSTQNPIVNKNAALKRRNHVLDRMLDAGFITKIQHQQAIAEPVKVYYHSANIEVHAPFVAEMIRQSMYQYYGKAAYTKGYKVYTTIKSNLQLTANAVVLEKLIDYEHRHGYRGPIKNLGAAIIKHPKQIKAALAKYPEVESMIPVIVTSIEERTLQTKDAKLKERNIPFKGFKWARRALKRGWYGPNINSANQVVALGDIIYIRQEKDIWALTQIPEVEAALVAMNPHHGEIEALVGGVDFGINKFNRATQSLRQPGSSFKPFIYTAALAKGYTLATLINDAPLVIYDPSQPNSEYRPHNYHHTFDGPTRLKEALVKSKNLVSLRILDDIGIDYAKDFVQRFGFNKANLPNGLSLALGSLTISPLDLTTAYAVFANGGFRVQPYLIAIITDDKGKVLLKSKPSIACDACAHEKNQSLAPRVLDQDLAFLMQTTLNSVIKSGTGRAALSLKRDDIAGKTGTTNDQVDAWFAGFHPDLVTTVWVGFDNPHSLHESGAYVALPLWIDFMQVALKNLPEKPFEPPSSIAAFPIDKKTGLLTSTDNPEGIMEYFQKDKPPEASGTEEDYAPQENLAVKAPREDSTDLF
ncbi:MAG: peptidase [Legionellales bacterium RIFCSPHIGHO2_12_FULL_37_14]|nr:MAG: peptidase [Legionellales bacterium RIFCSPHIGHO2_12_FULL_37_14]